MSDSKTKEVVFEEGFLPRLFPFFFAGDIDEKIKKRQLKQIAKKMRQMRPRIYNYRNGRSDPALAKLFYQSYQMLSPARAILQSAETSKVLKTIIIESSLTKDQLKTIENFTEENIRSKAESVEIIKLSEELKKELKNFCSSFSSKIVNEIQQKYDRLNMFLDLVHFDYFILLKKFDPRLPEADFSYKPHFEPVDGQYIVDDIKDFLEVMPGIDTKANWSQIFDMLKNYKQMEVVSRNEWNKFNGMVDKLQRSKLLEMMVQLIGKDPSYKPNMKTYEERILNTFLSNLKGRIEGTLQKIIRENRKKKIDALSFKVFGTSSVSRLKHYTGKANQKLTKKMLSGFTYIAGLNYLKSFLLDYCKTEIKEVVDLLLIKGKWTTDTTPVSGAIYDSFHQLLQVSRELLEFDASLDEEENLGRRIIVLLAQWHSNRQAANTIQHLLKEVNDTAKKLIFRGVRKCIDLTKVLKTVLDDYNKNPPDILTNWKELDSIVEDNTKVKIIAVYKKLYYFIKLQNILIQTQYGS